MPFTQHFPISRYFLSQMYKSFSISDISSSQHCHYDTWNSFFIDTQLCHHLTKSFRLSKPSISSSVVITFPFLYHFPLSYLHQPVHYLSLHRPCKFITASQHHYHSSKILFVSCTWPFLRVHYLTLRFITLSFPLLLHLHAETFPLNSQHSTIIHSWLHY